MRVLNIWWDIGDCWRTATSDCRQGCRHTYEWHGLAQYVLVEYGRTNARKSFSICIISLPFLLPHISHQPKRRKKNRTKHHCRHRRRFGRRKKMASHKYSQYAIKRNNVEMTKERTRESERIWCAQVSGCFHSMKRIRVCVSVHCFSSHLIFCKMQNSPEALPLPIHTGYKMCIRQQQQH